MEISVLRRLFEWLGFQSHWSSILKAIDQYGWTGVQVYGEGGDDPPDFTYTVGFSDFGAPELIVFSLDPVLTNAVLWEYFYAMRAGRPLADGLVFRPDDPELDGFECTLRSAVKAATWEDYVIAANRYSLSKGKTDRPAVMQVVWPSAQNGKYPWSPDCPATVIESQPALFEGAPPNNAGVVGLSC